jgi:hypothetical protein
MWRKILTRLSKELEFVLQTLNPFDQQKEFDANLFSGLNEDRLIKILKTNKLFTKFSRKLDTEPEFKQEFLSGFKKIKLLNQDLSAFQAVDLSEFIRISRKLANHDIHLLLIKSAGDFPHESSNFDCLIKPESLAATAHVLKAEGYRERLNSREPHKFLFRKQHVPRELPLHIHTRVEWEAVDFADPQTLRRNARPFMNGETGALVPSVEDAILITIAHYFFEDHEIKLYDLLKLWQLTNKANPDWGYMSKQTEQLGWRDAFVLNIDLLNRMSRLYFGRNLFVKSADNLAPKSPSWISRAITFDSDGAQKVPYGVSALFFLRKVFRNPNLDFPQKSRQISYVFSDILRRKSIGYQQL